MSPIKILIFFEILFSLTGEGCFPLNYSSVLCVSNYICGLS